MAASSTDAQSDATTTKLLHEHALVQNSLRVAVIGNVDSGKSSLTAVLTRSILDDGRGSARSVVFRHEHEKATGRSSAVATEILGFKSGAAVSVDTKANRAKQWAHVHSASERVVTFVDLCGHESYLKTTIFGLSACMPDYAQVIVGANMGVSRMTKEHIGIAVALGLPLWIIVTKIDLAPPDVLKHTLDTVSKVIKQARKMPFLIKSAENVATAARAILTERVTPIFMVSNVSGEGLPLLRQLLQELPPRINPLAAKGIAGRAQGEVGGGIMGGSSGGGTPAKAPRDDVDTATPPKGSADGAAADGSAAPAAAAAAQPSTLSLFDEPGEAIIDSVFNVQGVGTVVAGTVMRGCIRSGSTMLLGPDRLGAFIPCSVRSIHVQYTPVELAMPGGSAAFALRPKNKRDLVTDHKHRWARKGMSLVDPSMAPSSYWEFTSEILVLHHATTLQCGYAPVIHTGAISQSAKVTAITDMACKPIAALRTGDRALITARWCYRPEYIHAGDTLLFREGRAKGVGRIRAVACPNFALAGERD